MSPSDAGEVTPYSAMAAGYDLIMEHVDYEIWANFADYMLWHHHPCPRRVLELGCGTGSFALELQPLGDYQYQASDRSPYMIEIARRKARLRDLPVRFEVADFTNFSVETPVDAVILLYDGLNYVLEDNGVRALFRCVHAALTPGGLFFFDQSTPSNSINNEPHFDDEGAAPNFAYVRRSRYDPASRLHTTTFELTVQDRTFVEQHVQRAYEVEEIRTLFTEAGFVEEAAYDGFSTDAATPASERVHWVLRAA